MAIVLVVEDEVLVRMDIADQVRAGGFRVRSSHSARRGRYLEEGGRCSSRDHGYSDAPARLMALGWHPGGAFGASACKNYRRVRSPAHTKTGDHCGRGVLKAGSG